MRLNLTSDKVLIRGPKIDGSYQITFEVGEFERKTLAKLLEELDTESVVKLTIEQNEDG